MPQLLRAFSSSKRFIPIFSVILLAQSLGGCGLNSTTRNNTIKASGHSIGNGTASAESALLQSNIWAAKWEKNPSDGNIAINYARSLRAAGSYKKAAQVLQQDSLKSPKNQAVIAEYGKALSTIGQFSQAMQNLNRAQTLGSPDWRIYSAQGITLDRMEQHPRARQYYKSALDLKPNQSTVLNNIGLSYALEGDLKNAEIYLRRATAVNGSQPKVQKNLALILGLNGKFDQSAKTSNKVLSNEDTTANIAYLKNMLSQPGTWAKLSNKTSIAQARRRKSKKRVSASPRKITTLDTRRVTALEKKNARKLKKASKKNKIEARNTTPEQVSALSTSDSPDKMTAFSRKIQKILAVERKTASVDAADLQNN